MTITLQAHSLVEKAELDHVHFTLRLRDQCSLWMQDGYKVYMDSYMASNGTYFIFTWIIFKNHFLGVGLFCHVWGPAWIKNHWNNIWLRARSHMTSHYTCGSLTTLPDFRGVLGRPLDTFFWALTILWSWLLESWLVCEVALWFI
jgi:hypothetical protein